MTQSTRIAAFAVIATGIAFAASDAHAAGLGHVVIESAECKDADGGSLHLNGTVATDIALNCDQAGGAIVATWEDPNGDSAFEVFGFVATADGSWHFDTQFVVYENKLVADAAAPGLYGIFIRGVDSGETSKGGTVLRYREAPAKAPEGNDASVENEVEDEDEDESDNEDNGGVASSEAELIQQLMDTIADLENEIDKLKAELEDREDTIAELEQAIEELKAIWDKFR